MAESVLELKLIDRASPGLNKADANAKKLNKTVDSTSRKLRKGTANFFGFGKGASTAGNAALAAAPKVAALGAAVNTALGPIAALTGVLGAFGFAIGEMKKMDKGIAKFETLGGSGKELRQELKKVSKAVGGSASQAELAAASYDIASAGFTDAADAAMILEVAAKGAVGGFSDINTVGGATVKVINAYGLAAKDAARLGDMFAQTQADGIITIGQYSEGIGKVASVAAMLKVPLEEVNAAMALATRSGVNAEVAFTGLKASLLRLSGERGAEKLKKYGININAATLASEGLLANLKKLEGLDTKALGAIFGQEAIQTMAPILNNLKRYEEFINNQQQSTNALNEANNRMLNTIDGSWKRLSSTFSNMFSQQQDLGELVGHTIDLLKFLVDVTIVPAMKGLGHIAWLVNQIVNGVKALGKALDDRIPAWAKRWLGGQSKPGEELKKGVEGAKKEIDKIEGGAGGGKKPEDGPKKVGEAWKEVGNIIRNDVSEAIKGMMRGTQTLGQAALGILNKIADMFIDLAVQGMFTSLGKQGGFLGALFGAANGAHWKGGFKAFAQGGMVNEPTLGLVGEGGESEYIIPESKMSDAMNRYAAGARGDAVLAGGGGDVEGGGSGGAGGGSIDVRFTSERINDVSYVTFEQFQAGVQQAASEGAKRGEMSTLRRLQTSPSTRRRVGV